MGKAWVVSVCVIGLALLLGGMPLAGAEQSRIETESFSSNGDYIHGWYWLRDPSFNQWAEWVFQVTRFR